MVQQDNRLIEALVLLALKIVPSALVQLLKTLLFNGVFFLTRRGRPGMRWPRRGGGTMPGVFTALKAINHKINVINLLVLNYSYRVPTLTRNST